MHKFIHEEKVKIFKNNDANLINISKARLQR
jgi:hypothetical protein